MKRGSRTLGIAFSDGPDRSHIAGAVVRIDGTLDGLTFGTCTVGGTDATRAIIDLFARLDREDVQRVVCAGVAPAWFNVLDLRAIARAVDRPVVAVSFESSPGLEPAIRDAFDDEEAATHLETYRSLPPREHVSIDDRDVWVRAVGIETTRARELIAATTRDGNRRPEPVRVASIAAGAYREVDDA